MSEQHPRRTVLKAAPLVGAAIAPGPAVASAATERHRPRRGVTTFVFAAGANGGSGIPNELPQRGYRCVGVDLPGHRVTDDQFRPSYQAPQNLEAFATERSPLAGVTYQDQIAAAVEVVRRVAGFGPVVLVGSSIGGSAISLIANEVPDLIDLLVYDTAFCCVDLATPGDYLNTPEAEGGRFDAVVGFIAADPAVVGALRSNWRLDDPAKLAALKHAFIADGSDAEFYTFLNGMSPDELLSKGSTEARGNPATWGRIPRVYIKHTRDNLIPLALQERFITEADRLTPRNRFRTFELDTGHVPRAEKMAEFVDLLDRVAHG
ncbi:alpha/beta fold hydrolase [Amycolatopsis nigrescens]|uniref:alpha/beta fold hydrolase n=1 Tax=Amycolatopsis nigrescens TaxID=381445 RepID=UPI00038284BD|nr:alpha/beta hydrolase [Amycolatopsis nigrescens]